MTMSDSAIVDRPFRLEDFRLLQNLRSYLVTNKPVQTTFPAPPADLVGVRNVVPHSRKIIANIAWWRGHNLGKRDWSIFNNLIVIVSSELHSETRLQFNGNIAPKHRLSSMEELFRTKYLDTPLQALKKINPPSFRSAVLEYGLKHPMVTSFRVLPVSCAHPLTTWFLKYSHCPHMLRNS
ncbi:hypothetical protein NEOLEDRAFT_1140921 [Neolentinus lepideus HHB14362 ss-1]|uniref:Uncharacterized protein n=1 Tax=Neolentinus lepideus HHB14362 ss-1 TaxID=1314782 RepID=A0A165NZN5_9AGAM|nr:hypothetical protein NEOLEDRAFT_1140921 [Neolentinus lepideus HHB14362 ss-1]